MMKKNFLALAFGGLGLGMTEFVMMGLLPDIARDMHVSIPQAGHFISAYALGVGVGAPLLILLARNLPPKATLLWFMTLFVVGNAATAFSVNYPMLMALRFISGLPHGAYFGVGAVVAERMAAQGKGAEAVSVMFAGLTVANVLAVPLGTFIGSALSWRYTFGLVGLWGLVTLWFLYRWLPRLDPGPRVNIRSQFAFLKYKASWILFVVTMTGNGGLFTWLSYISPQMTQVAHFHAADMSAIMMVAGLGMVVGNFLGGKFSDKYTPQLTAKGMLLTLTGSLVLMFFLSHYKGAALLFTFTTTACALALSTPMQVLMIRNAHGSEMLSAAASQVAFNVGNAIGAYLGGLPVAAGLGFRYPSIVGAAYAAFGFAVMLFFRPGKPKNAGANT